jgi:hypothetical protein
MSRAKAVVIPAVVEVIAAGAFSHTWPGDGIPLPSFGMPEGVTQVFFESGTKLREIGEAAFFDCSSMTAFTVPSSVETIGDRCFERFSRMTTITFEDASRLRRIGKCAFVGSGLATITISASTQEIDGSTFVGCPLETIRIAPGSQNFIVEGDLLLTANRFVC